MVTPHRVLLLDIETAPSVVYMWRATDQYVPMDMLVEPGFVLGWSAKWRGEKKIESNFVGPDDALDRKDAAVVERLATLIREADVSVGHNIDGFDIPQLNNRLLYWNLEPLGPVRTIDTLKLAKKNFDLPWNKLDFLGDFTDNGRKLKTDMDLWKNCVEGDLDALARMKKYNRRDVVLLEAVFERMLPYVRNLPRLVDGPGFVCPTCGSADLVRRGLYRTQTSTWQRYHCNNCLRYTRLPASEKSLKLEVNPL